MLRFLVAARLQNLGGKPHQLAEILRGEVNEVQIPGTKIDLWRPLLDTLRFAQQETQAYRALRSFPTLNPLNQITVPRVASSSSSSVAARDARNIRVNGWRTSKDIHW